jgi:hypothetical protein
MLDAPNQFHRTYLPFSRNGQGIGTARLLMIHERTWPSVQVVFLSAGFYFRVLHAPHLTGLNWTCYCLSLFTFQQ